MSLVLDIIHRAYSSSIFIEHMSNQSRIPPSQRFCPTIFHSYNKNFKIDCTEEHNIDLCISQGVKGYPHLVRYKFGENTGDNPTHLRSSESIQKFMRKLLSFVSFHIKTFDQYEQFITHPDGAIIGVFDSTEGHATLKEADEEGDKKYFYKKGFNKIVNVLVDDHRNLVLE